jgi:hypothetical protein
MASNVIHRFGATVDGRPSTPTSSRQPRERPMRIADAAALQDEHRADAEKRVARPSDLADLHELRHQGPPIDRTSR